MAATPSTDPLTVARNIVQELIQEKHALFVQILDLKLQHDLEKSELAQEVAHLTREFQISKFSNDCMCSALEKLHARIEVLEGKNAALETTLKERNDHIDRLEALPKPSVPLPALTVQALGVLCKQETGLEIRRLQEVIAAKDAEIRQLREDLEESDDGMEDSD